MYQQLWGYKVEEKLYLGVREQKWLNTTDLDYIASKWLLCLRKDPEFTGSIPAEAMDFKGDKNPQHDFLRRRSKARGPMS
jgi:hypothetical protein